jgi:hypothetical protein
MSMRKIPLFHLGLAASLSLALSACGDKSPGADAQAPGTAGAPPATAAPEAAAPARAPSLADGPDVCFRAIAAHLGPDVPVSEINSRFDADGTMSVCTVDYQNPDDARKLVGTRWNQHTGQFSEPHDIEISVSGNAADFRLDDYLVPLSQVDAAALAGVQESLKAQLEGVYGSYAWTGVRLSPPDAFSDVHTLRLDLEGRIAANDIKHNGYASVSVDGRTVVRNHLLP